MDPAPRMAVDAFRIWGTSRETVGDRWGKLPTFCILPMELPLYAGLGSP